MKGEVKMDGRWAMKTKAVVRAQYLGPVPDDVYVPRLQHSNILSQGAVLVQPSTCPAGACTAV